MGIHSCATGPAVAAALAASLLMPAGEAEAALMNCPSSFTANGTAKVHDGLGAPNLTATAACQYVPSPDPSNTAKLTTINAAEFFGFDDWVELETAQTQVNANALMGIWSIPGADFDNFDYGIFFKSGAGTNLVGFLFNELFASGTWNTPFTNPPFDIRNPRDVSHYSILQRGSGSGPEPIPHTVAEPGALGLMGMGLLGLGLAAHRRWRLKA